MRTDRPPTDIDRPLSGIKMLILEDDPDLREALVEHFQRAGALVSAAADVAEARAAAAAQTPDVLLADFDLPDGTGHDFARELRATAEHVRAVALTGRADDDLLDEARAAGFVAHAKKPLEPELLIRLVVAVAPVRA